MLPEVTALTRAGSLVRLPPDQDVPVTGRVRRILDTAAMRRLASISQLGMVSLVYPGATHSRLEHSLGVYHNAIRFLARFADDTSFNGLVSDEAAEAFVVASLIHDIGHWPYCHPIEDMQLTGLAKHEQRIGQWLSDSELKQCIQEDWRCEPLTIRRLLAPDTHSLQSSASDSTQNSSSQHSSTERHDTSADKGIRFLSSCLSGPIDVDKLDYLQRDSLHCGVPYGRNFDMGRLINSLCIHPRDATLAVGEKGRTAAEMMVFARYVMFSEVYWHHAVRSATAMLQRAVFELRNSMQLEDTLVLVDAPWIERLRQAASGNEVANIVNGLFGPRRRLYKRAAEFNVLDGPQVHRMLARRPYWWLVACAERLAVRINERTGLELRPTDVLIDAPPVKLEVDINIDVVNRDGVIRSLEEVSPVASALARRQFDDQVKRVRVFVKNPERKSAQSRLLGFNSQWTDEILQAAKDIDDQIV